MPSHRFVLSGLGRLRALRDAEFTLYSQARAPPTSLLHQLVLLRRFTASARPRLSRVQAISFGLAFVSAHLLSSSELLFELRGHHRAFRFLK
ncbi:hypothetical protein DY000_02048211 [Brassica cretica]|uniref:Uncharacterized protein n=1 Tax=Brassica cretica TaxID=69181 RepID=A0ABQ7EYH6_BRACR|nr:hypothetical protein DY000_02048211 [Brassica cretica]